MEAQLFGVTVGKDNLAQLSQCTQRKCEAHERFFRPPRYEAYRKRIWLMGKQSLAFLELFSSRGLCTIPTR